jgi:hypothetical protein
MLVDPQVSLILRGFEQEICDPVRTLSYRLRGVLVADFVTRAWFTGSAGPYDYLGRVARARSLRFGYVFAYNPQTGYHVEGRGP